MASTNHAYDFSMFEPQEESYKPKLQVTVTPRPRSVKLVTAKALTFIAIFVSVITLMIYNQVVLAEMTAEINSVSRELSVAQNQEKVLRAQVESTTSLENIEERVTGELGLSEADDYQIKYVSLSQGDQIQIKSQAPQSFWETLCGKVNGFLEYIGVR